MILPNVILFPQAYLPLRIFEPRYRRMLQDALESHRMFCVALQQPARTREAPVAVAGLGLIRAAVERSDGTSNLILLGLARVELGEAVRSRPYRAYRFRVLASQSSDSLVIDALTARLLELVSDRLQQGQTIPLPAAETVKQLAELKAVVPLKPGVELLAHVNSPEQIADLVSWTLLSDPRQRQILLETLDLETRLKRLIQFLMTERQRPTNP